MKINLLVEYNGGTSEEVVCSASDLVKFEEKFQISVTRLEQEMRLTYLMFLAHSSLTRQGKTKLGFDEWMDTVATIGASETDPK